MEDWFKYFLDKFGPPFDSTAVTEHQIAKFSGELPSSLLSLWRNNGWSGFHDGILWLVNPEEYAPAVEAWFEAAGIPDPKTYHAIARSAFGELFLWSKDTGQSVIINPMYAEIITRPRNKLLVAGKEDKAMEAFLVTKKPESFDMEDHLEKKIFKRAVKKLGMLKSDEMYGFEPALAIGGLPKAENLAKVKIIEHLVLLAQLGDIEILHMDVSRHL